MVLNDICGVSHSEKTGRQSAETRPRCSTSFLAPRISSTGLLLDAHTLNQNFYAQMLHCRLKKTEVYKELLSSAKKTGGSCISTRSSTGCQSQPQSQCKRSVMQTREGRGCTRSQRPSARRAGAKGRQPLLLYPIQAQAAQGCC